MKVVVTIAVLTLSCANASANCLKALKGKYVGAFSLASYVPPVMTPTGLVQGIYYFNFTGVGTTGTFTMGRNQAVAGPTPSSVDVPLTNAGGEFSYTTEYCIGKLKIRSNTPGANTSTYNFAIVEGGNKILLTWATQDLFPYIYIQSSQTLYRVED